jgi:hypothetical protein
MRFSTLVSWLAAAALLTLVGCGQDVDKPAWCSTNEDCGPGQYCKSDGMCGSDCTDDNQCPEGEVCNEVGQCGEPDTDSSSATETDNTDPCGDSVLLVIDRSRSMANDGKWQPLEDTLATVLDTFGDGTEYGLEVFPDNSCPNDWPGGDIEIDCRPPDNLEVDIGPGTTASILGTFDLLGTCGGTPTAGALEKALDEVTAYDGEVQVILITDGPPNCNPSIAYDDCVCLLPQQEQCEGHEENCLDIDEAEAAAAQVNAAGAPVHLVTYAIDEQWMDAMNGLAASGGTGAAVECQTAEEVGDAVVEILDAIINC